MAAIKTAPAEELDQKLLLKVLTDFKRGDFSARMPNHLTGMPGKIADSLNDVIETSARVERELVRVGRVVGKEGKTNQIRNAMQTSLREGSQSLERSLTQLLQSGLVTEQDARTRSLYPQEIAAGPLPAV